MALERQLEDAVSLKRHEAFGTAAPQVEGLVHADILEVADGEDSEHAEAVAGIQARRREDLASERHRVTHFQAAEVEVVLGEEEPVAARPAQGATFANRFANVVVVACALCFRLSLRSTGLQAGDSAFQTSNPDDERRPVKISRIFLAGCRPACRRR